MAEVADCDQLELLPCAKHVGELRWLTQKHKNSNDPIRSQCLVCLTVLDTAGYGLSLYVGPDLDSLYDKTGVNKQQNKNTVSQTGTSSKALQ